MIIRSVEIISYGKKQWYVFLLSQKDSEKTEILGSLSYSDRMSCMQPGPEIFRSHFSDQKSKISKSETLILEDSGYESGIYP